MYNLLRNSIRHNEVKHIHCKWSDGIHKMEYISWHTSIHLNSTTNSRQMRATSPHPHTNSKTFNKCSISLATTTNSNSKLLTELAPSSSFGQQLPLNFIFMFLCFCFLQPPQQLQIVFLPIEKGTTRSISLSKITKPNQCTKQMKLEI